jgi:hypothetical protein
MLSDKITQGLQVLLRSKTIFGDGISSSISIWFKKASQQEILECELLLIDDSKLQLDNNFKSWNITSIGNLILIINNAPTDKLKSYYTNNLTKYLEFVAKTQCILNTSNIDLNIVYRIVLGV